MSTDNNWEYATVWEFQVCPGFESQFEQIYGPEGEWVQLFRKSEHYITTELLRDRSCPCRFVTIDFWCSHEHYEHFRQEHAQEYRRIDDQCEAMTERESSLGSFDRVRPAQLRI